MSQVTATISRETLVKLDQVAAEAKKSRNDLAGELLSAAVSAAHGKTTSRAKSSPADAEPPKGGSK